LFADLLFVLPRSKADAITDNLILHEDRLGTYDVDLNIVAGYLDRFRSCLQNFCVTLDTLFRLRPAIRLGLKAMLDRVLALAGAFHMGVVDAGAPPTVVPLSR
jgi:hypothetical protein